jgi:hypothetical protein
MHGSARESEERDKSQARHCAPVTHHMLRRKVRTARGNHHNTAPHAESSTSIDLERQVGHGARWRARA